MKRSSPGSTEAPNNRHHSNVHTYERLLESASRHAIFLVVLEGHIRFWSATAEYLYGYPSDGIIGTHLTQLWGERDQTDSVNSLLETARDEPLESEQWHERADGTVFWATCTISPVQNDMLHGFTVVSKDTTTQKQYERMLERQFDRLKEFTDILAHDLRNLLNVIEGRLFLYRETGDEKHLDVISETTERMERLTEELLEEAKQGDMVENPEPTDLEPIVELAAEGTLSDEVTLDVTPIRAVVADGDRLYQLFENLFRNAVEHGGSDVSISIGPLPEGFSVADDGPGIPQVDRSRVFDHGFSTNDNGSGFGLSIVRTIVESHGWDVTVTESTDGGAQFEISGITFVN